MIYPKSSVSALLRLKTLLISDSAATTEGWYDTQNHSRHVIVGDDPRSPSARMASLHEKSHSDLNETTGYGTCLILAGALARERPNEFEPLLMRLLSEAIFCHESYATAMSVYVVSGGRFEAEVLKGFPIYEDYLSNWKLLIDGLPDPSLAALALTNLSRAAMQNGTDQAWHALPIESWENCVPHGLDSPDKRISSLLEDRFIKVLTRVKPEIAEGDALGTLLSNPPPSLKDTILDAYGHLYFDLAKRRLEMNGAKCHTFNGHQNYTDDLIDKVVAYEPKLKTTFRSPKQGDTELDLLIADFAHEILVLQQDKLLALFLSADNIAPKTINDFLIGTPESPWLQLTALPKARLLHQYDLDPESLEEFHNWPLDPVTLIRRRVSDQETESLTIIELIAIKDKQTLRMLAESMISVSRIVVSTSLVAMQSQNWVNEWFGLFRSTGLVPVLMDSDPFSMMRKWNKEARKFKVGRIILKEGEDNARAHEIFVWGAPGDDILLFAPVSGALAGALSYYARQWPNSFVSDTSFIDEVREKLTYAIMHFLLEEREFGFSLY